MMRAVPGWVLHAITGAMRRHAPPVNPGPPNRRQRRYTYSRHTLQGPTHLQKRARNRARNKRAAASRRANR